MKRSGKLLIIICSAVLAIVLVISGGIYAKYINERSYGDRPMSAAAFYFESDYLTPTGHVYSLNALTNEVVVELYNFENELRVSEVDCTYTVTVETEDGEFALSNSTYEAKKNVATTNKITLSGLRQGYSYKVSVVSEGGYSKTLSAEFQIGMVATGFFKNVNDKQGSEYVILTVWSEFVKGDVEFTVPEGLIPDDTDPMLADPQIDTERKFTDAESFADEYSSRSYRFFKTDKNRVYTADDFGVSMNGVGASSANISNS